MPRLIARLVGALRPITVRADTCHAGIYQNYYCANHHQYWHRYERYSDCSVRTIKVMELGAC